MNGLIYLGSLAIAGEYTGGNHALLLALFIFYVRYMAEWYEQANEWDKQMADKTIKRCPRCKSSQLSELSSTDQHLCTNGKCRHLFEWKLKTGVESVLIKGKKGQ